jgi:bifunctional non-homologous end joining protein LigD
MVKKSQLEINGAKIEVSNLEKVFYPKTGFTKGQVIDFYIKISPYLLPHLKDRPISLKRYPDGVEGFFFYEKQCPPHRPEWVKTANVPRKDGSEINYCVMNDLPALVWAANLADLELHTFLIWTPARPLTLFNAVRSVFGSRSCLAFSSSNVFPRPPAPRDCRSLCL